MEFRALQLCLMILFIAKKSMRMKSYVRLQLFIRQKDKKTKD